MAEGSTIEDGRPKLRLSISTALMLGFGTLVFAGIASVFTILMWSARENTNNLLGDKAELANAALVGDLRRHLDPVRDGNTYIADLIARGEIDARDHLQLVDYITGAMAATPQILGMAYVTSRYEVVRVSRKPEQLGVQVINQGGNKGLRLALEDARGHSDPYWGRLVWNLEIGATMINLRSPVRRNGEFLGMLVSVVSVSELSRLITERHDNMIIPDRFILYGSDYVLAHRSMVKGGFTRSARQPLPGLDQVDDPVLARLWNGDAREPLFLKFTGKTRGHVVKHEGDYYPVIYRQVKGYGPVPLMVGAYIRPDSGLEDEINRLSRAGFAGLGILALALVLAMILGRRIGHPIRSLAIAARRVGALDFAEAGAVRRSRLHELDEAARAFNTMMTGLRWFETYVPRTLARRLIAEGTDSDLESGEHDVTVMFTDIARFTGLAEKLTATETAELLNHHFSMLAACIEAEDGTLDKFIGDSVMAFWGPPLSPEDHVERACRAALAIRDAIAEDNRLRAGRGEASIRIRIGLHTGPAIVGNIGAPGRINYTVVGDTVNIAQRLEELGKTAWGADDDVIVLVSGDVAETLGDGYELVARGSQEIRGRKDGLPVFRLMK